MDVVTGEWMGGVALWPVDAVTVSAGPQWWSAGPDQAPKALELLQDAKEKVMLENPSTYLLRTRRGEIGVVQLDGLCDRGRQATVRYRMLSAAPGTATASQPAPDGASAVRPPSTSSTGSGRAGSGQQGSTQPMGPSAP